MAQAPQPVPVFLPYIVTGSRNVLTAGNYELVWGDINPQALNTEKIIFNVDASGGDVNIKLPPTAQQKTNFVSFYFGVFKAPNFPPPPPSLIEDDRDDEPLFLGIGAEQSGLKIYASSGDEFLQNAASREPQQYLDIASGDVCSISKLSK
jgi:hypothetical protein